MKVLALVNGEIQEVELPEPDSSVPTLIEENGTYTIKENGQAVFMKRIRLEDNARIKAFGILVEPR